VYLQRQGYADLSNVEAALLCSDPATTVRYHAAHHPCDHAGSLERFAASVMQARIVLNPESAFDIVNRLLNPHLRRLPNLLKLPKPAAPEAPPSPSTQPAGAYVPAFAMPGSAPVTDSVAESASPGTGVLPQAASSVAARPRSRRGLTTKQIILLAGMAVIWLIIICGYRFPYRNEHESAINYV